MSAENQSKLPLLDVAFSPSAPVNSRDFFFGRTSELESVVESINERGQHVVLYGERGVGKTSFANIIATLLTGVFPVKVTCNRDDTFRNIWDKAFRKVHFERNLGSMGFLPQERKELVQLDLFLPDTEHITPLDVQFVMEKVQANLLFIFDEYDSLKGTAVHSQMADTIKALSDNAPRVTIMVVGIGGDVQELIGSHPSIERCLRQVRLPRMSPGELREIVTKGADLLGLTVDLAVLSSIVGFSDGFPHFTHLLAKQTARSALQMNQEMMLDFNLKQGLQASVDRVDESVRQAYHKATMTSKESTKFEAVLWACAQASVDETGTFNGKSVLDPYFRITRKRENLSALNYYLSKLATEEKGSVLEKLGSSKNIRYRISNPLLKAYAKLKHQAFLSRIPATQPS